jgi:branched-chain amino acid transport system ATP-binding protein
MLELIDVSTAYGSVPVNRNISIHVRQGEIVALVGRNGVGKSTLAKCTIGLLAVASGKIIFDGKDITKAPAQIRARAGMGYVPQGRGIFSDLTVEENLSMGCDIGKAGTDINEVLGYLPILKERRKQLGGTLSGGQQQMLSIGRVLMGAPKMLLLDEPSDGIQPNLIEEIGRLICLFNSQKGLTTFLIEQNLDLILSCATRCLIMEKGSIVEDISPQKLEDPEIARACFALLQDPNVLTHIPFSTYLVLACSGLKDTVFEKDFRAMAENPKTPSMLKQDMKAIIAGWKKKTSNQSV